MFRLLPVLFLAFPAFAQSEPADPPAATPRVIYRQRTEFDFPDVDVSATLVKPLIGQIGEARRLEFNPLIRLRQDFAPEMAQSIEEVR